MRWGKRRHGMRMRNCTHNRYVEPFQSLSLLTTWHCRKTDQRDYLVMTRT